MPIIPVDLPPGVYRNGTRYQSKGRWLMANRVRWHDGAIRPIGGWERKTKPDGSNADDIAASGEYARDGFAWRGNQKEQYTVWGTNTRVRWQKGDGTLEDILGAAQGLPPNDGQPSTQYGYGRGFYGRGPYGKSATISDPSLEEVGRWSFDTWGQNLLAVADWDGRLWEWVPGTGNNMAVVANAPTGIVDFCVTQERIVMTVGDNVQLRLVQWSDQENNTDWTPTALNQAGSYTLPGDGKVIGIYSLRNQNLILTETDAWIARYIGPPYVYGFEKVGEMCAPAHRKAAAKPPSGGLVWLGQRNFWAFDGTVVGLPCDLMDFLVADVSGQNVSKLHAWVDPKFSEVWFHYASVRTPEVPGSDPPAIEVEHYVTWNWNTNAWSQGQLQRSASIGPGVFPDPQMAGVYGATYWHERDGIAFSDSIPAEAVTGPIELGLGEQNVVVRALYPDSQLGNWVHDAPNHAGEAREGSCYFAFEARQMPTGAILTSPTYTYVSTSEQPIPTRIEGRDVQLHLFAKNSEENAWEWGSFRLDVVPGGGR